MSSSERIAAEPDTILDDYARVVVNAAFEVHRILGPGFLETTYEEALAVELTDRGIYFKRQITVPIHYKGRPIGQSRLDFLVEGRLVVELKSQASILPVHAAQLLSYLCAINEPLGLILNFNVPHLRHGIRRVIRRGG